MALPAKSVAVLIKEISSREGVCTSFSGLRGGGLLVAAQRCSEDVAISLPFCNFIIRNSDGLAFSTVHSIILLFSTSMHVACSVPVTLLDIANIIG